MAVRPNSDFAGTRSKDTLVLANRKLIVMPSLGQLAFIMLAPVLFFAAIAPFILRDKGQNPDTGWMDAIAKFWAQVHWHDIAVAVSEGATTLALLCMLFVSMLLMDRARRMQRLVLSPEGIRYVSPLPELLKRFAPDWFLAWTQVQAVELCFPSFVHPQRRNDADFIIMSFVGPQEVRRIAPTHWVAPESQSGRSSFSALFKLRLRPEPKPDIRQVVSESKVMRYLAAKQPQIRIDWDAKPKELLTSLEKDPRARIVLALFAVLVVYAFADLLLGAESYADGFDAHGTLYLFSGVIAAALSGLWLARSTLKNFEKSTLSMFLGLTAGIAMIPGALRINEIVGGNPLVTYDCRVIQDKDAIILQPLAPGIPRIEYFANNAYWQNFGKDELYPVQIRKGILGFYQFNSAVILDRIKARR